MPSPDRDASDTEPAGCSQTSSKAVATNQPPVPGLSSPNDSEKATARLPLLRKAMTASRTSMAVARP